MPHLNHEEDIYSSIADPVSTGFEAIISPISKREFVSGYLHRQMLLVRGAPSRFCDLVSWDNLDRVLASGPFEKSRLKLLRAGQVIDPATYTHLHRGGSTLDAGKIHMLLTNGATIVLSMAEERLASLADLAQEIEETLDATVNVNLYASWGGPSGTGLHSDTHDVLVLQVRGRKRWDIFAPTTAFPLDAGRLAGRTPEGAAAREIVLKAGDALYLPRGWWHEPTAIDGESLHLTIAIRPPRSRELLNWLTDRLEERVVGRMDIPPTCDPERRKRYFDDLFAAIREQFEGGISDRHAEAREAERPAHPLFALARVGDALPPLDEETPIRLAGSRRIAFSDYGTRDGTDGVRFLLAGREWHCAPELVPALRLLHSARAHRFGALIEALPDEKHRPALRRYIQILAAAGMLFLDDRA